MSYTPPGYPGQPQQPVSPDGRWWWDGTERRPNAANPFGSDQAALGNPRDPKPSSDGVRFTPGPPGVPNPYVPSRLGDDVTVHDERRRDPGADDVPFVPGRVARSWWTPSHFAAVLVGVVLVVVLAVGVLFWLSVTAFQRQRGVASDVEVRTAMFDTAQQMSEYRTDYGSYPTDLAQLKPLGYEPGPRVDLTLVPIEEPGTSFCLAAGPKGAGPTMWYSGQYGPMDVACG